MVAGRYQIARFLGRGGMGEVYAALDRTLGEPIAIKTLSSSLAADARAVARFRREALLARRVTHPCVCRTYDIGSDGNITFLTMELLEGETLGSRLRREGRLPLEAVLEIMEPLAAGLDSAHQVGVIHRDFKPDNVMLIAGATPANARVVITDFGLALLDLPDDAGGEATLPLSGRMMGTLGYMAPEQIDGATATSRTDLYALGVVAFEMLTGHLPFVGPTPLAGAIRRLRDPAPPPSRFVSHLPAACDPAIQRCLAREPHERFATARDFVRALRGEPARPSALSVRARSLPALLVATAAIAALFVAGMFWRAGAHGALNETPIVSPTAPGPVVEPTVPAIGIPSRSLSVASADEPATPRPAQQPRRATLSLLANRRPIQALEVAGARDKIETASPRPPLPAAPGDDLLDPRLDDQLLNPYAARP